MRKPEEIPQLFELISRLRLFVKDASPFTPVAVLAAAVQGCSVLDAPGVQTHQLAVNPERKHASWSNPSYAQCRS